MATNNSPHTWQNADSWRCSVPASSCCGAPLLLREWVEYYIRAVKGRRRSSVPVLVLATGSWPWLAQWTARLRTACACRLCGVCAVMQCQSVSGQCSVCVVCGMVHSWFLLPRAVVRRQLEIQRASLIRAERPLWIRDDTISGAGSSERYKITSLDASPLPSCCTSLYYIIFFMCPGFFGLFSIIFVFKTIFPGSK